MKTRFGSLLFFSSVVSFVLSIGTVWAQEPIEGYAIYTHDPSTLIKESNRYYYFMTSQDLVYHWSTDLRNWNNHGSVFPAGPPAWTTVAVPSFTGHFWAPDVAYFNGKYHVYYSISEWGTIDSAIGLVTSPSLVSPSWTDQGKVVQSDAAGDTVPETDTTAYNCIDPSILVDTDDSVWMTFGSYSSGILVTEIDPATGLRMNTNSLSATLVANNADGGGWGSSIEGAFTYKHGGYYYLFVNYGGCCSGVDSTYNIRVGRSTSITGPYYDKAGVDMRNAGGTMLLESSGRFIGPGHAGILDDNGTEWFSYHYYDGNENGAAKFSLLQVSWDAGGWPVLTDDWSAFYPFEDDAHEHMDLYDGTLQSGGGFMADEEMGTVLDLDGSGYVELPDAVANCSSVAAWVKWNGGSEWQRIFDFGTDTTKYMFLTPKAYGAGIRFAIKNGGAEQIVDAPFEMPTNTWCHLAVTLDGEQGTIYFNGDAVATDAVDVRPWEMQARTNIYIGKSQWPDPGFDGRIASFRVFAHALSPEEVREVAYAPLSLAHRYAFSADAADSIGKANGRLMGNAAITGEMLSLPGTVGSYANLPGGLVSGCGAVSIEFWADIEVNGNWARVFDFGNYSGAFGNSFLFFTPGMSASQSRMDVNGTILDLSGGNLNNQSAHVVCVVDPSSNYCAIYVNGILAKQQTVTTPALSSIGNAWSFLGRSLFSADPYLNAEIDEFRIYDGRLAPDQISGNYSAGPDAFYQDVEVTMSSVTGGHTFEWPSTAAGFELQTRASLGTSMSWSAVGIAPGLSNGRYELTLPVGNSNAFYRLSR